MKKSRFSDEQKIRILAEYRSGKTTKETHFHKMKISTSFHALLFSNILTVIITALLMIELKKKEVTRRDQVIMTALLSDVTAFKLIEAGRIDSAKNQIYANVEIISSARNHFSIFGYEGWRVIDDYLNEKRKISEPHSKNESD